MSSDTAVKAPIVDDAAVAPVIDERPLRAWAQLGLLVVARAYRAFLLTLVVVASVPMLWNWSDYVVRSGSMEPAISVGDVVVAKPFRSEDSVPVGRVMVFTDPSTPEDPRLLVHRVVEDLGQGNYATAGDANFTDDSSSIARDAFRSRAIILVPWIGLPFVWLATGDIARLLLWIALTAAAFVLAARLSDGNGPGWGSRLGRRFRRHLGTAPPVPGPSRSHGLHSRIIAPLCLVVAAAGLMAPGVHTASAAFIDTTTSGSNTWSVGALPPQPYSKQVLADSPYVYYRVDEASGTSMADGSGNNRTGTYTSVASYRQAGALPNNFGYGVGLNGNSGRLISGGTALTNPTTYSLELWFKTTTAAGGKLIGFESSRTSAASTTADRHVFMRPDGKLTYGGWDGSPKGLLNTTAAYNNGVWHHLVLTVVPGSSNRQDSALYVDGARVASGLTTREASYSGWWRAGFGRLPTGSGYPASANFVGSIDNVAVYRTQLSAARISAHYAAR